MFLDLEEKTILVRKITEFFSVLGLMFGGKVENISNNSSIWQKVGAMAWGLHVVYSKLRDKGVTWRGNCKPDKGLSRQCTWRQGKGMDGQRVIVRSGN